MAWWHRVRAGLFFVLNSTNSLTHGTWLAIARGNSNKNMTMNTVNHCQWCLVRWQMRIFFLSTILNHTLVWLPHVLIQIWMMTTMSGLVTRDKNWSFLRLIPNLSHWTSKPVVTARVESFKERISILHHCILAFHVVTTALFAFYQFDSRSYIWWFHPCYHQLPLGA